MLGFTLQNIKGLKFPDLYIVKFFFKNQLDKYPRKGLVLELGCGNGNNLALFRAYEYKTIGVDINKEAIENAKNNFRLLFEDNGTNKDYYFINADFLKVENYRDFLPDVKILLIPSSLYYVRRKDFIDLLKKLSTYLSGQIKLYIRFRSPRDSRVMLGKRIGENEFLIKENITGELNQILTVYEESEMIELLKNFLGLKTYQVFHIYEENIHSNLKVLNADIVIWGDCKL